MGSLSQLNIRLLGLLCHIPPQPMVFLQHELLIMLRATRSPGIDAVVFSEARKGNKQRSCNTSGNLQQKSR